jgi:hypothetical protein
MKADDLLHKPFDTLGFSDPFCEQSELWGYRSISDVISVPPTLLLSKPGFTHTWLEELTQFLINHDALYLLQPTPGKNYD